MQIKIHLSPDDPIRLDFSYYPKLSAAVYQAIHSSDPDFAKELHDGEDFRNRIKLFGFSPLHSRQTEIQPADPQQHRSGGIVFKGRCKLVICSPLPELMSRIGEGFLRAQHVRIGSQLLRIREATLLPPPVFAERMVWRSCQPASFVTSWSTPGNGKRYVLPGESTAGPSSEELLIQNLIHKWRRLRETRPDIANAWLKSHGDFAESDVQATIMPLTRGRKSHRKRHFIKSAPVLSWIAPVEIVAPLAIQRIAWSCGLGEMNSMGFGVVEENRK